MFNFYFFSLAFLCPCQEFYKNPGKEVHPDGVDYTHFNDAWAYYIDEDRWEEITPAGDPPPPIRRHAAVYDPIHQCMIVCGGGTYGFDNPYGYYLFSLSLAKGSETWSQRSPEYGEFPGDIWGEEIFYHPAQKSIIAYKRLDRTLYIWDLETLVWEKIDAITPPSSRGQFSPVWDNITNQMFLFGGLYRVGASMLNVITYNELWTYAPGTNRRSTATA